MDMKPVKYLFAKAIIKRLREIEESMEEENNMKQPYTYNMLQKHVNTICNQGCLRHDTWDYKLNNVITCFSKSY